MLVLDDDRAVGRVFNVGGGQAVTTREFADVVRRQYGSDQPGVVTGEYRFGDTRHILSDIGALRALGWEPRRTPADSVAAYADWLEGMDGLDGVLAEANARMRALGVVRKAGDVKAFLLAAGIGSRLRPITDATPKCMLAIGDRPLLDIWLDAFDRAGVDEVLVNLHHLPDVVRRHIAGARRAAGGPHLLRAGTARQRGHAAGQPATGSTDEDLFLACNADNLTDFDLRSLIDAHRDHGPVATLTVFHSPNPSAGGVVELDAAGRVIGFTEKPAEPVSDLVNAGMYAFHPSVLDEIDGAPPRDIGYDLLPRLVGRARAVPVDGYFRDIGTADAYRRARQEWPARALR